jgi:hypothetical protein
MSFRSWIIEKTVKSNSRRNVQNVVKIVAMVSKAIAKI